MFGHFQIFTTVKICFTIKLYLTHKMTFNMESFKLFQSFVVIRTCNMIKHFLKQEFLQKQVTEGGLPDFFQSLRPKP